ncbi:uncharacterized protein BDZ99DRAFT_280870 [Mytilinidion resinicola]|uniref:Uncharacterized protein n=1 Tax=Mytilinidion resinicola TaxID=574789 RepID=A0A6A6YTU7_9PEZI|nr:uncharacterized protein BDZ99DRAFT_280870 [Mytilinidion resinicola]KAF2811803.1 hypothetical protein BDZ99DRAFT_280870 [Mytilinidion resinicola]
MSSTGLSSDMSDPIKAINHAIRETTKELDQRQSEIAYAETIRMRHQEPHDNYQRDLQRLKDVKKKIITAVQKRDEAAEEMQEGQRKKSEGEEQREESETKKKTALDQINEALAELVQITSSQPPPLYKSLRTSGSTPTISSRRSSTAAPDDDFDGDLF